MLLALPEDVDDELLLVLVVVVVPLEVLALVLALGSYGVAPYGLLLLSVE